MSGGDEVQSGSADDVGEGSCGYVSEEISAKKPIPHGSRASFVVDRDVHQLLRKQYPEESYNDEVICSDYTADFLHGDGEHAVELSKSNAKMGPKDRPESHQTYHLKIREIQPDGTTPDSAPLVSLALAITPQYENTVYKPKDEDLMAEKKDKYPNIYGTGRAKIGIQTSAVQSESEFEYRALDLLNTVLHRSPEITQDEVIEDSRRLLGLEVTHRIHKRRFGDLLESLWKSKQLLPGADNHDKSSGGCIEEKFGSEKWDMLGFDSTYPIKVKAYNSAAGSSAPGKMHHPRVEVLLGSLDSHPHLSEFDEVTSTLEGILLSHLEWAGIDDGDIVEGQLYPKEYEEEVTFDHPTNRRWQLRDEFMSENRRNQIIYESMKSTRSIYDLLRAVISCHHEGFTATYEALVERTGIKKRTVRYHVKRLVEKGILNRTRSNVALIEFVSGELRSWADEKLRRLHEDETGKDRQKRIEDRKAPEQSEDDDSVDDSSERTPESTRAEEETPNHRSEFSFIDAPASGHTIPPPK